MPVHAEVIVRSETMDLPVSNDGKLDDPILLALRKDASENIADKCGCRLGSQVASITLTGYLALAIALPLLRDTSVTFSWWQALAVLLGGALVGKTLGVLRARRLHDRKTP
jgi:hypothetical protein